MKNFVLCLFSPLPAAPLPERSNQVCSDNPCPSGTTGSGQEGSLEGEQRRGRVDLLRRRVWSFQSSGRQPRRTGEGAGAGSVHHQIPELPLPQERPIGEPSGKPAAW